MYPWIAAVFEVVSAEFFCPFLRIIKQSMKGICNMKNLYRDRKKF